MKKLIIFLAFLFLIALTFSFKPVFYNVSSLHNTIFSNVSYNIYCLNVSKLNLNNAKVINNGNGYIVKTDISSAIYIKQQVSNILGESISFISNKNAIEKIIKFYDIEVLSAEIVDGIEIYYGYSSNSNFTQNILIDGNLINVQIAFKDHFLTMGTPIILGEY